MSDPNATGQAGSRFRISTVPPSSVYTFSHIFPPDVTQSDFFNKTTLPMVHDVLSGQNGLLFTYGVTNSGKTFTIQGGNTEGSAGILPRTLDVMFNSIDGLHADGKVSLSLHPWYLLYSSTGSFDLFVCMASSLRTPAILDHRR